MKRDLALKALDDAVGDHVSLLFRTLINNLEDKDANARGKFAAGLGFAVKAYAEASASIEALPE